MKKIALLTLTLACACVSAQAEEAVSEDLHANRLNVDQLVPYAVDQAREGFAKTDDGGIMHIAAKPGSDSKQIELIQQYLKQTAAEFSKNDFSSTERFHGTNMPGLARMKAAKPGAIKYQYKALPDGAEILFSTRSAQLLSALHDWIEAQIREHGHAVLPEHD